MKKELDLLTTVKILWNKKLFLILNVFTITSISIIISLFLPKWYKSSATILPPSGDQSLFSPTNLIGGMGLGNMFGDNSDTFRFISILKSRNLKQALITKFDLVKKYKVENDEEAFEKLENNMEVDVGEEMQIRLHIWDKDQDLVAPMVNYALSCLDSINIQMKNINAKNMREFISTRMDEIFDSLKVLENDISSYMEEKGILSIEDQVSVGVLSAAEFKSKLILKEIELNVAKRNYSNNSSQVQLLKDEVCILQKEYNRYFSNQSDDDLFLNFKEIPDMGIRLNRMERNVKYYATLLEYLGPQYEKSKIDEKKDIPTFQVLDKAYRPEKKDKPHRALIVIIVFIISWILSISYVIVKEGLMVNHIS